MRSELDVRRPKDVVLSVLSIVAGVLLFGTLLAFMIYRKQTEDVPQAQAPSESYSELTAEEIGLSDSSENRSEALQESTEVTYQPGEYKGDNTYQLPDKETITFTFAGDVLLDDNYSIMGTYRARGSILEKCIDPNLLARMRESDLCLVNNEFTYTDRGEPTEGKSFTFRAKPENVEIIKEMGVDVVSIGNNHTYDYGEVSLLDTIDTLEKAELPFVGAGRNLEEASKIIYYENDHMRIGLVCATQIERYGNPNTKGATEDSPGTFRCMDPAALVEKIKEADANCDVVVLYVHWGTESTDVLDRYQIPQATAYAEAGADVIVGAHPHVLQEIGYEGDVPVFYSLGNFWFSSKNLDSCLLTLEIGKEGVEKAQFVPAITESCSTLEATDAEKVRILDYMRSISEDALIDENGYVTKKQ